MGSILAIDDQPGVLDVIENALGEQHDVALETSPAQALERAQETVFDVVIADFRMPEVNGSQLLTRMARLSPTTTQVLMSGNLDLPSVVAAVNHTSVFRILLKPFSLHDLRAATTAAVRQTELVRSEKELLEETLTGSIAMLSETLSLASPLGFERSNHARHHLDALLHVLDPKQHWAARVAVMVSQICTIAVPEQTLERAFSRTALSSTEVRMLRESNEVLDRVLQPIARLEPVRTILAQVDPLSLGILGPGSGARHAPLSDPAARAVQLALDFDALRARGATSAEALEALHQEPEHYSVEILAAFSEIETAKYGSQAERELTSPHDVNIGTVLSRDVIAKNGVKIVAAGYRVTETVRTRLINFAASPGLDGAIWVVEETQDP